MSFPTSSRLLMFSWLYLTFFLYLSPPLCTPSAIDYSVSFFYGSHCIPFWQRTITLADKHWVLAAFMATCHIRRRYLKQHVYWYCNKTKAINQFRIGPHLFSHSSSENLLHPHFPFSPPSVFSSHNYLYSSLFFPSLLPSPSPCIYIIPLSIPAVYLSTSLCLSAGQGTLRRLIYCPSRGRALTFWCVPFFSRHRLCLILFPSLSGENKACFFVCSGCGLLGQGGSHKPSKSETLWSRFFDLLLFLLH